MSTSIDASKLVRMFLCGVKELQDNKDYINELNVFPVPDGDTGTNMTLTMISAVREVASLPADASMFDVCKAMSSGSLRGARGNSGVIMSQLIRGFCKAARENDTLTVDVVSDGIAKAVSTAYKAVMKPKEGTILTVAKAGGEKAAELMAEGVVDFDDFLGPVIDYTEEVLAKTPDMLPVLKEAGVVDSGGQGLLDFYKGLLKGYNGESVDPDEILSDEKPKVRENTPPAEKLKYTYKLCFDLVLTRKLSSADEKSLYAYLSSIGETTQWKTGEELVSVIMQTNDPGLAIQKCLFQGQITNVLLENQRMDRDSSSGTASAEETAPSPSDSAPADNTDSASFTDYLPEEEKKPFERPEHKETAFITVAAGDGLAEIFRSLGADEVITGGQTMNPSTDDLLNAIDRVNADTIFMLPNNKNIVMAANQAAKMCEDLNIQVIPTRTIPQGITAIINYVPGTDPETARDAMLEEIANVRSAEVTYSVRDTQINGITIKEGDFMSIGDSGILSTGKDLNEVAFEAVSSIADESVELISIYYGSDASEKDAEALLTKCQEAFPGKDIELQFGGQPVYYYILSAE